MYLKMDTSQGIRVKWKHPNGHFIQEVVTNILLFKKQLQHRKFMRIGENSYGVEILHNRVTCSKGKENLGFPGYEKCRGFGEEDYISSNLYSDFNRKDFERNY